MTGPATTEAPAWRLRLSDVTVGAEELEAVTAVLASGWLSAGPVTRGFELEFAAAVGAADAVAVSSGTAALHLALLAAGLTAGDEVILPSLSFVAAAALTALHGATPVFADVRSPGDLTVDPDHVEHLVTGRTRAIVAMHYAGYPADVDALAGIARRHGVALIEDAAHAPCVVTRTGALGTVGDAGCFSFFATKNLTTGEGGMVVARDPAVLATVRSMRAHAMTTSTWARDRTGAAGYDVTGIGLNYRPTEIAAAIGRVQLGRLGADRERRCAVVDVYRHLLGAVAELVVPFADHDGDAAHHLMAVVLPRDVGRDEFRAAMRTVGVQTSVHYPPTHRFSFYARTFASAHRRLPVTDDVADRLVSLPLHARMSDDDAVFAATAARDALLSARGR